MLMDSARSSSIKHYTQDEQDEQDQGPPSSKKGLQKVVEARGKIKQKRKNCTGIINRAIQSFALMTSNSMAERPLTHFCSYCGILGLMAIIVIAGGYLELSQLALVDFQIIQIDDVRNDFALSAARQLQRESADFSVEVKFRETTLNLFSLFFLYEKDSGDLLTPQNVQKMCQAESTVLSQVDFPSFCLTDEPQGRDTFCADQTGTISLFFYPNLGDSNEPIDTSCPIIGETEFLAKVNILKNLPNQGTNFFLSESEDPKFARSIISFGGPLGSDSPPFKDFEETETLFLGEQAVDGYSIIQEEFKDRILELMGVKDFDIERFEPSGTTMKAAVHGPHLSFLEFQAVVQSDTLLALGSFAVVTTLVSVYTRSFFFGLISMGIIVSSIMSGLFLYAVVFQISYFNNLHILVLFIIMGIGADNIFVLFDAWRQSEGVIMQQIEEEKLNGIQVTDLNDDKPISKHELGVSEAEVQVEDEVTEIDLKAEELQIRKRRLHFTYTRAFLSVAHTATTTFLAFLATSISRLAPIASFGLFAAFVILMNLVYMANILPAALMVHHVYVHSWFEKRKKNKKKKKQKVPKKNFGRKVLEKYIYLVNRTHFAKFAILGTVGFGILMTVFALQLETPTSVESNFRKEHMFTVFQGLFQGEFNTGNIDTLSACTAVFGIAELDSESVERFSTDPFRGNAIFDADFQIFSASSQEFIINVCDALAEEPCNEVGCAGGKLINEESIGCWVREFQTFFSPNQTFTIDSNGIETGLSEQDVIDQLEEFVTSDAGSEFFNDIGIINNEIKFVTLRYRKTMQEDQPLLIKQPVLELLAELTDELRKEAPEGMQTFYQTSFDFVWQHTEEELVSGLYQGMAISLAVSFLVVLAGTRSLIVSSFAIIGVATIVMCVLGSIQRLGFELGTAEALAGVMVIGLAVDYTVHLGHMFVHAKHYFLEHDLDDLNKEKELAEFNSKLLVSMASMRSMSLIVDPKHLIEETKKEKEVYNSDLIYYAVDKMGMTVLAGAVTTFSSAVFLLATTLAFFGKMAVLIGLTVLFSTIYAFLFFVPMLRVFGPGKRGHSDDVKVTVLENGEKTS